MEMFQAFDPRGWGKASRAMAEGGKPAVAAGFGSKGIDRKIIVMATAGMHDLIGTARD